MKKRLLAVFMTFCMMLSMVPATFAEGEEVAKIGDTTYATLDDAVKVVPDGGTIELLGDATTAGFNLSKSVTIKAAESLEEKPTITFTQYGIALWGKALTFQDVDVIMNGIGSTPYTAEWNWMTICASKDASLTLDNVEMTMDATGTTNSPHAIYFCSNNKLNIQNGSTLTIKNYVNDALEWDGGDGGYNVNITDSTFVSDYNRSGFTGTFYATIKNSHVEVINSRGNGSNGSHFVIENSTVNFSDNGSHGLSAGNLSIEHSDVTANNNKGMGIAVAGNLTMENNSKVTVTGNASNGSYGYAAVRLYNDYTFTVDNTSELYINNNYNTGLYVRQGNLTVEDGAKLEIMGNNVTNYLLDGYGGGLYVGYGDNYDPEVVLPGDAKIYNNHSPVGGDDIYVSEGVEGPLLAFGEVGSDWVLDDCNHAIDGWYDDSENNRWSAHSAPAHTDLVDASGDYLAPGPFALKAAHGLEPIQPGDETGWEISKSKTATNLDENYESQITLSLPAASYERTMDVVFVIDDTHAGSKIFYDAVNSLLDELAAKDTLDIKVGVVAFDAVSRDWLSATSNGTYSGLVSIRNEEALEAVQNAIETQLNYEGTGTMLKVGATNTEWPVDMAKDMLDQGTGEEQYLIMFSDLYGYVYRGDLTLDGTTYHDVPLSKRIGTWNEGSLSMGIKYDTFAEAYAHKDEADDTLDGFFRDTSWDSYWTTYQNLATAPENTIADEYQVASGTYSGFEKSLVLTYDNLLKAAEDAHVILVNNSFSVGEDALSAQGMVQKMLDTLEENSSMVKTYRYETSSADEALQGNAAKGIFDGIREDLIQLVDEGTTVEDYMGYVADDYNFNFVNDKDKLSMKVGDQTYSAVLIEENKYGFAYDEASEQYDYILTYVPGNKTSDEHFVWTTNVAVTKDAPVQLIYSVELMNPKTTPGTYGEYDADGSKGYDGLYTNNKAILYPVDSDGVKGLPEAFPKPTVDYTVDEPAPKTGSLTISKTVNGTTDRTILAEKFTFKVTFSDGGTYPYFFTKGGSASGSITSGGTIKIANGQTVSINGIPAGVEYTVSEIRDKDFNTTVSNSDGPALVTTYRTDTVDASGTIQAGIASIVHFTNTWKYGTPSGGGSGGGSKPELNKDDHIAYVSGYPDGTVQPQGYVTREEVATIFFRLLTDASRAEYITEFNPYPDVQSNRWSFYAITTMTNGNLMLGRPDGGFDPGANITRAEFAVVAAQFSDAEYSGPDRFTDISDHWARDYINRAANEGWIAGYPDGSFGPDRYITRAEVMALVNEVLERGPDADYMLEDMIVWPDNPEYAWYYEDVQEATNSHSYVWRNSPHTSEEWLELIPMRTFDELVRDAFNAAGK